MEQSDIVERLRGAAQSWRQEDALEGRIGEEEARLHDEAAAEIERLRAALAAETERCAKVAETEPFIQARDTNWDDGVNYTRKVIATAIRASGS